GRKARPDVAIHFDGDPPHRPDQAGDPCRALGFLPQRRRPRRSRRGSENRHERNAPRHSADFWPRRHPWLQDNFPIPLGQSATWDEDLIRQAAREAALEATADGIHWTFAPMIDISRDPRWGRVAESL